MPHTFLKKKKRNEIKIKKKIWKFISRKYDPLSRNVHPYISTLLVISFFMWWRAAGGVHRFFDALSIPLFARARETPSPAAAAAHHTRRSTTDLTSPELVSIDRQHDRWCPVFPINNSTREVYREYRPSFAALPLLSFEEKIIIENATAFFVTLAYWSLTISAFVSPVSD